MQKKIITLSALVIFSGVCFSPCAFGQTNTLAIRQEKYTFKMPVTKTVTADTFVISEDRKLDQEIYSKKDKNLNSNTAGKSSDKNAFKNAVFATCLFRFDSSVLVPLETDKILSILSKKKLKNS
ncbi:MAG TPA: hypothetical protein ENJ53_06400, partial [Phaeodactylibacter sp.]|nr:hypothetical protein [Phaeodactylibacter sp.]